MPDTVAGYWHDVTLGEVLGHGHQRWELELETKVRKDFIIITEKTQARAFSWLKAPTSALTFNV